MPEPLAMTARQGKASAGSLLREWTDSLHVLYSSRGATVHLSYRIAPPQDHGTDQVARSES